MSLSATTTATQGNPLSLNCNPIGQPSPSVTWYKDNVQLVPSSRVSIDSEDRLVFISVISTDGGSYRCEATNSVGVDSAVTTLTVLGEWTWQVRLSLIWTGATIFVSVLIAAELY